MSHNIGYPNIRSRVRLGRAVRAVCRLDDYDECGLERFRPHPKARDTWMKLLWRDFDGIGKAKRSSGWKSRKARKQWEHNVRARERRRARRGLAPLDP